MRNLFNLKALLILASGSIFFTQCDSVSDNMSDVEIESKKPAPTVPSEITQIADTVHGVQAKNADIILSDYFESEASINKTQFTSDIVNIEDAGNGIFVFSQADSIHGTQLVDVLLVNEDSDTLETQLKYVIAANAVEPGDDEEDSGEKTGSGSNDIGSGSGSDDTGSGSGDDTGDTGSGDDNNDDSNSEGDSNSDGTDDGSTEDEGSTPEDENDEDPQPQPQPSPADLVIMPLGDSMTNDSRSRVKLWNLLTADGHEIDYVGNQYQESTIPDADHEGVGGIKIHEISEKIVSLINTHKPEYVNLMVGTNDIAWYFDDTAEEIAARWDDLVQKIFDNSNADTYVIAATIPPVTSKNVGKSGMSISDRAEMVKAYNKEIRKLVSSRQAAGDNIVLADMEAALNVNEHVSGDGVHLNDAGYATMGTVYYKAITSTLN